MREADEVRSESKLDTITHLLLRAFPGDAILSTRTNDGNYLLTICSADLEDLKTLHIAKSFLSAARPTADEIPLLFNLVKLPAVLGERGEYTLSNSTGAAVEMNTNTVHGSSAS